LRYVVILKSRYRDACLNRVLAPEGELLSFAPPKESSQRKVGPLPLKSCAPRFCRGSAEGAPAPLLTCGIPAAPLTGNFSTKAPVLGAANGIPSVPQQVPTA